jgi:putative ABC transport system substrate-binding protein
MRTIEEAEQAFESMTQAQVAGFLVLASQTAYSEHGARLGELALKYRLPGMFGFEENVRAGGLMSYSADILDLYRRSAAYIDKILKGVSPADLPIEQPTRFELVINLKTAKALGVEVPPTLLARADEVIE